MTATRAQLVARKNDILAAVRLLERDRSEGVVDGQAYRDARDRYEREAAAILSEIDAGSDARPMTAPSRRVPARILIGSAGVALVAAVFIALSSALLPARSSAAPTSSPASTANSVDRSLARARTDATRHPQSASAFMALGNAYVQVGDMASADRSYRTAVHLAPGDPEALTLHAMMVGAEGKYSAAITVLRRVESSAPTYARAWLVDGLFSSHLPSGRNATLRAWREFLRLQPHGAVSDRVRHWVAVATRGPASTAR